MGGFWTFGKFWRGKGFGRGLVGGLSGKGLGGSLGQELLAYGRIRSDVCGPVYLLPFHRIRPTFDMYIKILV